MILTCRQHHTPVAIMTRELSYPADIAMALQDIPNIYYIQGSPMVSLCNK